MVGVKAVQGGEAQNTITSGSTTNVDDKVWYHGGHQTGGGGTSPGGGGRRMLSQEDMPLHLQEVGRVVVVLDGDGTRGGGSRVTKQTLPSSSCLLG